MNNNDQINLSEGSESEIDLLGILFFAWENKVSLFTAGIIFFLFGVVVYLFIFPHVPSHQVKIEYSAPSSSLVAKFNNLPLPNEISTVSISKEKILSEFQDEFNEYEVLFDVIEKNTTNETKNLSKIEKNAYVSDLTKRFEINNSHIHFTSTNIEDDLNIILPSLSKIISNTGENVREEIQNQVSNSIDGLERNIESKLSEIDALKDKYMLDLEFQISFLEENLKLAKKLGISENKTGLLLNDDINESTSMQMYIGDSYLPYYLRGSFYIEEELNSLKNRVGVNKFINDLPDLQSQVNQLEYNKQMVLKSAQEVFRNLPVDDENLIRFNVNSIEFIKNNNKRILIPIMFLFLGILFQLLSLYVRKKYLEYKII